MSKENGHGGARTGAGRPRTTSGVKRADKIIERKLKTMAEMGWGVLADAYPSLMTAAVDVALGDKTRMPNVMMLRTLLELMVRVVGSEPDQSESQITKLVNRFIDRAKEANRDSGGQTVDVDSGRFAANPDGRLVTGTAPDSAVPGVEPRFHISLPK